MSFIKKDKPHGVFRGWSGKKQWLAVSECCREMHSWKSSPAILGAWTSLCRTRSPNHAFGDQLFFKIVFLEHSHDHKFTYGLWVISQYSVVVATETRWPTKPKRVTIRPVAEKVCPFWYCTWGKFNNQVLQMYNHFGSSMTAESDKPSSRENNCEGEYCSGSPKTTRCYKADDGEWSTGTGFRNTEEIKYTWPGD